MPHLLSITSWSIAKYIRYIMLLQNRIPLADLLIQTDMQQKGQRSDTNFAEE